MKIFSKKTLLPFLVFPVFVFAYTSPGAPTGFVNDYADLLTAEQETSLENKLSQFEKETENEIAVVTVESLEGDTVENFAEKLFQEWGIGKEKEDNGLLILVAEEDRQMRIEVGYGLEGDMTDAQSFWVIERTMKPAFRQDDYFGGLDQATSKIISSLKQEEVIPNTYSPEALEAAAEKYLPFVFVGFIFLTWLISILARSSSWWAGGVFGGIIALILTLIFGFLFIGLLAFFVLIPLGLLLDFLVSKAYKAGKSAQGKIPWWAGGGGFGGGHGGFGGGGFGGFGGGSSGGGGASGRW